MANVQTVGCSYIADRSLINAAYVQSNLSVSIKTQGLPWWLRWLRICLQCRRPGFDPWVGKIPWRRAWQPTPVFLPRKSHGQRSPVGYSPWDHKESDILSKVHTHTHTHTLRHRWHVLFDSSILEFILKLHSSMATFLFIYKRETTFIIFCIA